MESWINVFTHISETKLWDTLLGCCTMILLLSLKKIRYKKQIIDGDPTNVQWNETKKYLQLGRNALAVVLGTVLAYSLHLYSLDPFSLTGEFRLVYYLAKIKGRKINNFLINSLGIVSSGLPEMKVPPFELTINNETLAFVDIIKYIGSSVIAIPLISILESVAVAKAFCKGNND